MEVKWSGDRGRKYSCIKVALALINRPGLSYCSNISRRQTKLTRWAESCVPADLPGHCQPNVSHKAEQKQTRCAPQRLKRLWVKGVTWPSCSTKPSLVGNVTVFHTVLLMKHSVETLRNCSNRLRETKKESFQDRPGRRDAVQPWASCLLIRTDQITSPAPVWMAGATLPHGPLQIQLQPNSDS